MPCSAFLLICLFLPALDAFPQDFEYNPAPKNACDGILADWGRGLPFDPITYRHLYDNEAQWIENSHELPNMPPPGDPEDEPLREYWVIPEGRPMGSGFNIISALVSFDPRHEGGTYWLAIDLPGPTNRNLSDSFPNRFVEAEHGILWYPIPFDVDCNENRYLTDALPNPGAFGSIISSELSDEDDEWYKIWLWVGGDETQAPNLGGPRPDGSRSFDELGRGHDIGFPIYIEWREYMKIHEPYSWRAIVPGKYLKDHPGDLVLGSSGGGGCGLVAESNPIGCCSPHYDIEIEIRGVITKVFPLIDTTQTGYPMMVGDVYHCFVAMGADSDSDFSAEEKLCVGLRVPRLTMIPESGFALEPSKKK
jgi:hypothetical protein